MATVLQGDPFNLQGSAPAIQGGATAAVLQPAASPQPPTANPQQAAVGIAPRGPAAVFYKPNANSQQVFNANGEALSYDQFIAQGGKADFSNVVNTALPGMAPAAPVSAPQPMKTSVPVPAQTGVPLNAPASMPASPAAGGATFYKPDPNSQQVYDASGRPLNYEQYIAAGGKPDFSNVISGQVPGVQGAPAAATPAPKPGMTPIPPTPPAAPEDPNQERIDQLSKQIFSTVPPSQQKLYEEAFNASGLATIRTTLEDLNKRIAAKQEAYTSKEGDINENPFLSEASRIGRLRRLEEQKQAEIGNLLDQYKQYTDLYNNGINEINDSVARQVGDFNTTRQIGTEELNFLLGISDKEYDRKKDEQATQRDTETDARTFALQNNITQPFYTIDGRTIIRTSDGKAYSTEADWLADGGKPELVQKVEAQAGLNLKDYPGSYQEYLLAQQQGYAGSYIDYQNDDANRKARASGGGNGLGLTPNQINSTVNQIAGAFDNEPVVKEYNTAAAGYQTLKSIGVNTKSPADDIAFIYGFAKVMDPGSVVRDSEYDTIQKYAQNWAQTFGFKAERIFSNTNFLSSDAKQKMLGAMEAKYKTLNKQYQNVYSEYQRQIEGAYTGQPRQITDYSKAFNQPEQGGSSSVDLNDLF
jgi:hypothetical protein